MVAMEKLYRELEDWLASLPQGTVQLVASRTDGNIDLRISPTQAVGAAKMVVVLHHDSYSVGMGAVSGQNNISYESRSPVEYCRALLLGNLEETVYYDNGRVDSWVASLRINRESLVVRSDNYRPWMGLKTLARRGYAFTKICYTPYYEIVPELVEPFGEAIVIPPILARSGGDVELFRSVREAESSMEPWDTINNPYDVILDSQGTKLDAIVPEGKVENWTTIGKLQSDKSLDELRQLLMRYLLGAGLDSPGMEEQTLSQLIHGALRIHRVS